MFKRILVINGSDCAEQALSLAERITRASGGTVWLQRDGPAPNEYSPFLRQSTPSQEEVKAEPATALDSSSIAAQPHFLSGAETKKTLFPSPKSQDTLDTTKDQCIDLIIVPGRGTTCFKRWMRGSVAQRVEGFCTAPILVLNDEVRVPEPASRDTTRSQRTITAAVALDGSMAAEAAILPAAKLVVALAAPAQGALHLVRIVCQPSIDALLSGREQMDSLQRDQAIGEAMDYLRRLANDLDASLGIDFNISITWSIAVGSDLAEALIEVAEQGRVTGGTCICAGCDLLVLESQGCSKTRHLTPGCLTERIFERTKLPILFVRPPSEELVPTEKKYRHKEN